MSSENDRRSFGREFKIPPKYRSLLYDIGVYGSAIIIATIIAFPLYWMAQSAFIESEALLGHVSYFPTPDTFSLARFDVLSRSDVQGYLINSVIVTIGTILTVIVISLVAGYGLARFDFKHKVTFARFLLLGYVFSPIVLALPLFMIWKTLGLYNTHLGLILALSAISMPFAVWLMWKYIQTIPRSMEESAWTAGASRWRGFIDVVLPQTKPAIIANALFSFALAWNDFTFAQILLPRTEATTFPVGLLQLVNTGYATGPGQFLAAGLLVTIPPLLFAYFLQSYLLKGFQIRAL